MKTDEFKTAYEGRAKHWDYVGDSGTKKGSNKSMDLYEYKKRSRKRKELEELESS